MRLLRDDLIISSRHDGPGCLLLDQQTGQEYEFGEVEQFLLEHFREPCDLDQLCGELNTRFGLTYALDDLESFLNLLEGWDLLRKQETSPLPQPPLLDNKPNEPDTFRYRWYWFNPERVFDGFNRLFPTMRWTVWLTPILVAVGTITVFSKYDAFLADFAIANSRFAILSRLALMLVIIHLAVQIVRGIVARDLGLATPNFGMVLVPTEIGYLPRFNVQIVQKGEPERAARLRLTAVSTLVRLWLFGIGVLLWVITRPSGSFLSIIAIEVATMSFFGLLFVANPFWRGDGANFLSAWLEIPNIRQSSFRALIGFFIGRPAAIVRHSRHNVLFGLSGLIILVLFCGYLGFVAYSVFHYLESRFQGFGVALFLILCAYAGLSIYKQRSWNKAAQASKRGNRQAISARSQADAAASASDSSARINRSKPVNKARPWGRYVRYIVLLVILVILFLPYRYEAGGNAEVYPAARATITLDTSGLLEEVNVKGGEHVKAGTVLAKLADYNQWYDLHMLEADIESKKYQILQFRTTPSSEDIRLAEEKIRTARIQATYSEEKLVRQESLALQGFISPQALADVRSQALHDQQALEEAIASLESLKVQINPYQIESLTADLEHLQRQAEYDREKLRRTRLISPIDGQVVTEDLEYLRNSYLAAGKQFATVEDKRTVALHIMVPHADLKEVSIGATITLRLYAYSDRDFVGKVEEIVPVATTSASPGDAAAGTNATDTTSTTSAASTTSATSNDRYVKVIGRMNNPDGLLLTGLTGFAKITGNETIVLLAFTRALIRYVTIDVWSWLP